MEHTFEQVLHFEANMLQFLYQTSQNIQEFFLFQILEAHDVNHE